MTTIYEIEYLKDNGEYDYLQVPFNVDIKREDPSFAFSYGSENGTYRLPDYLVVEFFTWNKAKFSNSDNLIIQQYIDENKEGMERDFLRRYEKLELITKEKYSEYE